MSTVSPTITALGAKTTKIVWTLALGDDGAPISVINSTWRSFQATGGITSTNPLVFESSNDGGSNWFAFAGLSSPALATAGAAQIADDRGLLWRPRWVSGGSASGTVDVILVVTNP
jgi:hypothetical protein